jgi:hypothetical protein
MSLMTLGSALAVGMRNGVGAAYDRQRTALGARPLPVVRAAVNAVPGVGARRRCAGAGGIGACRWVGAVGWHLRMTAPGRATADQVADTVGAAA